MAVGIGRVFRIMHRGGRFPICFAINRGRANIPETKGLRVSKRLITVGVEIPGVDAESVDVLARRSLLDADIVVFVPEIPNFYGSDTYNGKTCLSDDASFRAKEALAHWHQELAAAVEAGKLVVILLKSPQVVFAATGQRTYSGTGRSRQATRIVDELSSYAALPVNWTAQAAHGDQMLIDPKARFFAPYWAAVGEDSEYQTFLGPEIKEPLVTTRAGNRVVGASVRKKAGAIVAVPYIDFEDASLVYEKEKNGKTDTYWTKEAMQLGKRFVGAVVALASAIASEVEATPPPPWTTDDQYRLPEEPKIEEEIRKVSEKARKIEETLGQLRTSYEAAGQLRGLLFEQGKPLEAAVLEALRILGFTATTFKQDGSEFDAVFQSPEGRFLGEVEGKDNKAINIDKLDQLERNLAEDFNRDGIAEFAKGVLFGNSERLKPLAERGEPFTAKCKTAAKRGGVALVHTPDLFFSARYVRQSNDAAYAESCRKIIFATFGEVVVFPSPPAQESDYRQRAEAEEKKT